MWNFLKKKKTKKQNSFIPWQTYSVLTNMNFETVLVLTDTFWKTNDRKKSMEDDVIVDVKT